MKKLVIVCALSALSAMAISQDMAMKQKMEMEKKMQLEKMKKSQLQNPQAVVAKDDGVDFPAVFTSFCGVTFGEKKSDETGVEDNVEFQLKRPFRRFTKYLANLRDGRVRDFTMSTMFPVAMKKPECEAEFDAIQAMIERKYGIKLKEPSWEHNEKTRFYSKGDARIELILFNQGTSGYSMSIKASNRSAWEKAARGPTMDANAGADVL